MCYWQLNYTVLIVRGKVLESNCLYLNYNIFIVLFPRTEQRCNYTDILLSGWFSYLSIFKWCIGYQWTVQKNILFFALGYYFFKALFYALTQVHMYIYFYYYLLGLLKPSREVPKHKIKTEAQLILKYKNHIFITLSPIHIHKQY